MNTREKLLGISKTLYFLLIFLIPVNLGKHFELLSSYVGGVLVDYLVPTIFIQDILVVSILLLWIFSGGLPRLFKSEGSIFEKKEVQFSALFVFSLLLSTLVSSRFIPSIYSWVRVFLYFSLFLYTLVEIPVEDNFFKVLDVISVSVLLVSILGIVQFIGKGSVFNNYLIFGEQPYSAATFGVPKEFFLRKVVVPAYGLFRHPNIFGGFLSITLIWLFSFLKRRKFYIVSFVLGTISLLFTFSYISWAIFLLGIIFHLFFTQKPQKIKDRKKAVLFLVVVVFFISLLSPLFGLLKKSENPSVIRRINFTQASYRMIKDRFLFGVGFNNSVAFMDSYNTESKDIRFSQPVHNVFLLIFSEAGVFSFFLFIGFIWCSIKRLLNSSYFYVFLISVLQIVLLSSFDHYFLTIHQTLLLFWIVLGLGLQ